MPHQLEPSWETRPRTTTPIPGLHPGLEEEWDTFVHHILERGKQDGSIKWQEGGGYGGFSGLSGRINKHLNQAAGRCSREFCSREIDLVGIALGNTSSSSLEITCDPMYFPTEQQAQVAETQCLGTHRAIGQELGLWVAGQNAEVARQMERVQNAEQTLLEANDNLDRLL